MARPASLGREDRSARRGAAAGLALASWWGLALGCGGVSLDEAETSTLDANTSTGLASTTEATSSTSVGADGASTTEASPDLPPESAGVCAPGCELELPRQWFWRGPSPSLQRNLLGNRFTAITQGDDGSLYVAEERGDQAWLTRLDPDGEVRWSNWVSLVCDCQIVSLVPNELGVVNATAEGELDVGFPVLASAAIDVEGGTQIWNDWIGLAQIGERKPRTGSSFLLGTSYYAVLVIEPDYFGNLPQSEAIQMFVYDVFGGIIDGITIDRQAATDPAGRPVGAARVGVPPQGPFVVAFPTFTGGVEEGYAVHMSPETWLAADAQPLPGRPLAAAAMSPTRVLVASGRPHSDTEVELHVAAQILDLPPAWERTSVIESTALHPAALGLDPEGRPLAAIVGTPADSDEVRVELIGLELDGTGRFRETVVMPAGTHPDDFGFAVTEDGAIVLATTVDDHAYVEQRTPTCVCE